MATDLQKRIKQLQSQMMMHSGKSISERIGTGRYTVRSSRGRPSWATGAISQSDADLMKQYRTLQGQLQGLQRQGGGGYGAAGSYGGGGAGGRYGGYGSLREQLLADTKKAYDEAKKTNLDRYAEIKGGYEKREADARGTLGQIGAVGEGDIRDTYSRGKARTYQDMVGRGMANPAIMSSLRTGIDRQMNKDLMRHREGVAKLNLQTMSGLSGDRLRFMERREDPYPNQQMINQMMMMAGRGSVRPGGAGYGGSRRRRVSLGQRGPIHNKMTLNNVAWNRPNFESHGRQSSAPTRTRSPRTTPSLNWGHMTGRNIHDGQMRTMSLTPQGIQPGMPRRPNPYSSPRRSSRYGRG